MKLRITIAGNTYEAEVEVLEDEEDVTAAPAAAYVPVAIHATAGAEGAAGNHDPVDKVCRSPVTGLVVRVNVEAGQTVEAGQLLMVLEAMKMETQVAAPCAGVVESIRVAAGASVKLGQVLLDLG